MGACLNRIDCDPHPKSPLDDRTIAAAPVLHLIIRDSCAIPVMQTIEMEAMLREVYGERFADSPAAALTLKRVKGEPWAKSVFGSRHGKLVTGTNKSTTNHRCVWCWRSVSSTPFRRDTYVV